MPYINEVCRAKNHITRLKLTRSVNWSLARKVKNLQLNDPKSTLFVFQPASTCVFGFCTVVLCSVTKHQAPLNTLNTWTKEMILGHTDSTPIPSLSTPAGPIQLVTTFKLLGLHLDASLSWTTHINTVVSKASKRLYFLKQLKRAGVPPHYSIFTLQ